MKALIITGKMVQDQEYIYPYYRLEEEGYEVEVAAPEKTRFQTFNGIMVEPDKDIYPLLVGDYDVLILPGGAKAMEYLRQNQRILDFIAAFYLHGKVIGSICHGAQLLISAGLVKGKRISGYYSIKDDIENAGGTYVDAPYVVDSRIVTSPHYKHLGPWMKMVLIMAKQAQEVPAGDNIESPIRV